MFEQAMNEALAFNNASYLDVTDLRALYYGRRDVYVAFSDDAELEYKTGNHEIDRPLSVVCYTVNDVVGKKVSTPFFYAHVFRISDTGSSFIDNIRQYDKKDLEADLYELRRFESINSEMREDVIREIMGTTTIRLPFEKLWTITEYIAKMHSSSNYEKVWKGLLMELGYTGFADPTKSGILTGKKEPAVIYLEYEDRINLDILEIQKYRNDRRRRVTDKVDREIAKMSGARNRIAKKRKEQLRKNSTGLFFRDLEQLRELL